MMTLSMCYDQVMTETWKSIKDYPDYEVSDLGRVRSWKQDKASGKLLVLQSNRDGYHHVILTNAAGRKTIKVHHLVLEAFAGPNPFDKKSTRHLNGIKMDNRIANLTWGTPKQQMVDQREHGSLNAREKHGRAKLTEKDVAEIRRLYGPARGRGSGSKPNQFTQAQLAERFGVKQAHISLIIRNQSWGR